MLHIQLDVCVPLQAYVVWTRREMLYSYYALQRPDYGTYNVMPACNDYENHYQMNRHPPISRKWHLIWVSKLFCCEIRCICISRLSPWRPFWIWAKKRHLPLVDFGVFFHLDIWYPKEHVSSGMALIKKNSNQNLLLIGLYVFALTAHIVLADYIKFYSRSV